MKKIFWIIAVAVMTVLFLIYPQDCLDSAKYGLQIWFNAVLPSLLPFMTASFILLETGVVRLIAHVFSPVTRVLFAAPGESAYVFFAAAISGYPVGAKLACELYEKNQISESDAQRIVRFTSVSGPVFITGAVSVGLLGVPEAGIYLAVTHYLSAALVGVLFGMAGKASAARRPKVRFKDAWRRFRDDIAACKPLGELLGRSVEKAIITVLQIGGFIVLFSVVMEMLSETGIVDALVWAYTPIGGLTGLSEGSVRAMIYGSIEMTTGCNQAALLNIGLNQQLPVMASIIAFGGLCVQMQTRSVCMSAGLMPKQFVLAKSLQALFAYALCSLALAWFPVSVAASGMAVDTKTAAYYGIVFAAAALILLLIIKIIQIKRGPARSRKTSVLTFTRKL